MDGQTASSTASSTAPLESNGMRRLRYVYTADSSLTHHAVFTKQRPGAPKSYDGGRLTVDNVYAASTSHGSSPTTNRPYDHAAQDAAAATSAVLSAGTAGGPGGGTLCRIVDVAPRHDFSLQRESNLDYAIVVEGSLVLVLGNGDEAVLGRGDVAVQRATRHLLRNPSETEWARVVLILQDCQREAARRV
ncbi:hypothetical protein CDD81_3463 [Ophiocordyceps australis]|uniref:Cupin 2 conserved barrel domain-containing protein n=1 Tax=Ophiocordyceps australis TaxID=1399860 RepID=A0A2C5Y6F1_9HYPO|nr:hypothetical protein CDD81_3463 [Ophiocordyceps australis]